MKIMLCLFSILTVLIFGITCEIADSTKLDSSKDNEILYVCENENKNIPRHLKSCVCSEVYNSLYCDGDYGPVISTLNLKIKNEIFIIKLAYLSFTAKNIRKNKILPGRELTVENLHLQSYSLKNIEDGSFDAFTNLKDLTFDGFSISIDDRLFTKKLGKTLEKLTFMWGSITTSSKTFKHLTELKYLSFLRNEINFSKELFSSGLVNLEELAFPFCTFTSIGDDWFENLRGLKILDLSYTLVSSIPKAINFLSNLNHLILFGNNFTELKYNESIKNANLKKLSFNHQSDLILIDDCAFCSFPNLDELNLDWNPSLEKIHENAFGALSGKNVSKIKKFNVQYSLVTILPEGMLDWMNVKELILGNNKFVCNCSMAWLINNFEYYAIQNPEFEKVRFLKCSNPPNLKDKTFEEISIFTCESNFTESTIIQKLGHQKSEFKIRNYKASIFIITLVLILIIIAIRSVLFIFNRKRYRNYQKKIIKCEIKLLQ